MFKALLSFALLFSTAVNATGYIIHEPTGPRIQVTGVTTDLKSGGQGPDKLEVTLLSGPEGTYQCSFPVSALHAQGYKDVGSLVVVLASPEIRTYIHCYTADGKSGSTTSLMIDNRF